MKKLLSLIAVAGIMVSCNNEKAAEEKKTVDTTATTTPTENTTTPTTSSDVPKFADAEVQKMADEYAAFAKEYIDACNNKDMAKFGELGTKAQDWSMKMQNVSQKLAASPDEAMKWTTWITKVSQDMSTAATNMTK